MKAIIEYLPTIQDYRQEFFGSHNRYINVDKRLKKKLIEHQKKLDLMKRIASYQSSTTRKKIKKEANIRHEILNYYWKKKPSPKIKNLLNLRKEKRLIEYEAFNNGSEKELAQEKFLAKSYEEAWSNLKRYQEAKLWEEAALSDWAKRIKQTKK